MTGNNSSALLLTTKPLTSRCSLAWQRRVLPRWPDFAPCGGRLDLMCIRPVTMPARASLAVGTKRGSNASCRNGRQPFSRTRTGPDRQRPIGQPHNGGQHPAPSSRAACGHCPSPACAPIRQNRLVPAAGPHAQQEEHTTPHTLSFSLPNHDLTNDSPRGAELPLRARLTACGGRCGSATSFSQFTCVCGCRLPERASPILDEENARSTRAGMTSNYLLVTYGWLLLFIKSLRAFMKTSP